MSSHLIYHPVRQKRGFSGTTVYFDKPRGNQDPYVWNERFLHTYCHRTELRRPVAGDIQFWIAGDAFPAFKALYCDLVFEVQSVNLWSDRNCIEPDDPIVDSQEAYVDHYRWAGEHPFKKRLRETLKADPNRSFQPQHADGTLVDVLPFLISRGFSLEGLREALRKNRSSKPMPIEGSLAAALYQFVFNDAALRLHGAQLQKIRSENTDLASPDKPAT